ncbi:kinase-like protein [Neoconidiobolus thromboides FSU 785]|nr:kinase-like protein [Neoconidiobolus thromboides FSU 785]
MPGFRESLAKIFKRKKKSRKILDVEAKPLFDNFEVLSPLLDACPGSLKYNVRMKSTNQVKTLKIFRKVSMFEEEQIYLKRIRDEIFLSSNLDHRNILKPIDLCHAYELYYVITDGVYFDGRGMIDQGYVTPETCTGFISDLLSGLLFLKNKGIVHLNINLESIVMTSDGVLKLSNFDFAMRSHEATATPSYYLKKSDPFCSPEFVNDRLYIKDFNAQDIWGAGILIYSLLTGSVPWDYAENNDPNFRRYLQTLAFKHLGHQGASPFYRLLTSMLAPIPDRRISIDHCCVLFNHIILNQSDRIQEIQHYIPILYDEPSHFPEHLS